MKHFLAATAAVAFTVAAPVAAQQPTAPNANQAVNIQPGASVYGSGGGEIGIVAGAQSNVILLRAGEQAGPINDAAISTGTNGPTRPTTRAELGAMFDQQMAAYQAKVMLR